ncbi:MAG: GNAT family N-acetyltransferase [Solirubrobacterales bacterium]
MAADAATRGFLDNEIWTWLLPKDRARARVIKRHHRSMVKHVFLPRNAAWTTAEGTGGAFWFPPGTKKLSFREAVAESLPFMPEGLPHMGKAARFESEIKKRWPKEPHWYLAVLSVSPESQGAGHGSALLKPGLERVDQDGVPAYLETQRETNVGFYEKFGFELVEKLIVDEVLPVWLMYRPARGVNTSPG